MADRYGALRPDSLNSPMLKTPLGEFSIVDNLWSDDVLLTPLQTDKQPIFFHMTLLTVDGIRNLRKFYELDP